MKITIDILETDKQIVDLIIKEIVDKFNKILPRIISNISINIKTATFNFLKSTPTYESLVNGELAGHFGLPANNRTYIVDSIIKAVSDNMVIEYKPLRYAVGKFRHGIYIRALKQDMSDVLTLPGGTVFSENGDPIPWLEWLLLEGDKIIIRDYEIDFRYGQGRSGLAVMDETDGGVWRVPAEFSGTITNNWLTQAIKDPRYLSIIKRIIESEINGNY